MAHNPHLNYGYPPAGNYYLEDPEGFVADYSDSDALSDNPQQIVRSIPPQNVTEIYSRKCTALPPHQQLITSNTQYQQDSNNYVPQYYYEKQMPQLPRTHVAVPLQNYPPLYDHTVQHQYCPISTMSDTNYETMAYRNSYRNNIAAQQHPYSCPRNAHQNIGNVGLSSKPPNVKRYPITVGTPKYYRKPLSNSVYKRPSALCLPVASQPDPALYRRPKRSMYNDNVYGLQQDVGASGMNAQLKQSASMLAPHKMDSEGDVNIKISNLEDMLDKIERQNVPPKLKNRNEINKISKFLKPKVPHSIKAKQEKTKHKGMKLRDIVTHNLSSADINVGQGTAMEDVTADSLEKLLTQLKKCEFAGSNENIDESGSRSAQKNIKEPINRNQNNVEQSDLADDECKKRIPKSLKKSFNYDDITNQMLRSQSELKAFSDSGHNSTTSIQDITKRITSTILDTTSRKSRSFVPKAPLDDNCALELHKSKSYIVNLIDRALSKELGTVPGERSRKDFDNMNPKKAIELMNRHTGGKSDKELSLEITSALTESLISNATAPENNLHSTSSRSKCCCNAEEPTYIKQLKQLRWGHLKHIQREVRRLEDLERFLDSCSITTIPEI